MRKGLSYHGRRNTVNNGASLAFNFLNGQGLDPLITFTRASSATFTGSNGLIQSATTNTPRFDYDPVTLAAKGLLIEEQRTNLLTYSEQFDNAAWSVARCTITANTTVAPDGTTTADTLVEDTTNNSHPVFRTITGLTAIAYTGACYIKANVRTQARIAFANTAFGASPYVDFDLSAVTANGTNGGTGTITSVGNGWYRCTATATAGAAGSGDIYIQPLLAGAPSYLGTGANALFIWGAQLEAGSFATSYIPTVASQVTRSADVASVNTLSPWYNATEGTLYAEATFLGRPASVGNARVAVVSDGTTNNLISAGLRNNAASPGMYYGQVITGGVTQALLPGTSASDVGNNTSFRSAIAYKTDDIAATGNGATPATDLTATIPVVNRLIIGSIDGAGNIVNGHIRRLTYYPRRLSNAELVSITT